jgi:hypothetical protein
VSESAAPGPQARGEFHTDPHPDPLVQSLIEQVEQLRAENAELRARLEARN